MANIINLPVITTLDLPPDRLLESAVDKLGDVVIIGHTKDGEFYFASSKSDGGCVIWLLELAKKKLLDMVD